MVGYIIWLYKSMSLQSLIIFWSF